jgi:hypothetical protein
MRRADGDGIPESDRRAARGLGWASLTLGLLELAAPRSVERLLGLAHEGHQERILQTLGLREILHGVDLLSHPDPRPGVWARVAGDALDGVLLAAAAGRTRAPGRFAAVSALVLGIVARDVQLAGRLSPRGPVP